MAGDNRLSAATSYFLLGGGGGGGGGGRGASPVQVKDSINVIHGSLEESSPYRTGVYFEYLLRILERDYSSMHRRKEDKLCVALSASDEPCFSVYKLL